MPTSVVITVVLSVMLGILVIFLPLGGADTSASTAADRMTTDAETADGRKNADFPQVHWDLNQGSGAYLAMLDHLRNLAETSAKGRITPDADTGVDTVIPDETECRGFADVVISCGSDTPTVHAVVRLSDFCVVRFFSDTPADIVLNLASDCAHRDDASDDDWFLGKAGYDTLARVAKQPLTSVNLSQSSLENSLGDLGFRGIDRTAQARGMLRYLIAITEASQLGPIAHRIASGMDTRSDVFLTAQQVGLMRHQV
ncbi:ribosome-inactivating family protein [Streptomyces sp. MNU76]|uniref:ribosome-inactivating family protein n=1 Tax=Streptomyces sp. MNU76 TaxID=2560026 RepID=UPI001E451309|nr:ribosome-inactivating family protein [Streptomyces sp. MNU76]MCC9711531.1 ribosome-inactivating family protein [Streptomyces sp. MNU76]